MVSFLAGPKRSLLLMALICFIDAGRVFKLHTQYKLENMTKKKIRLVICFTISFFWVSAQRYVWSPDSIAENNPNYGMDRYHDVLRYHNPFMYLAYPIVEPLAERQLPLEDGEGKDGYWLEGNFAYRFAIYKGKYYNYSFFQRLRPTLDVDLLVRLTKDLSNPLLPSSNKIGVGLDFLLSSLEGLKKEKATLVWATGLLHHYSNGQADSFFIENPIKRNNYRNGDFSTNYYKVMLNIAGTSQQRNIVSGGIGFQKQVDLGGPLASSKELEHYYGSERALFTFQWTTKPRLATFNYQNRATAERDTVRLVKRRQVTFRTELDYILKGVSEFTGENKRKFGWHNYLTYMPSVSNEVGFILHTYLGRDYLNIRFDDVVFVGELGVCVKFNGQ